MNGIIIMYIICVVASLALCFWYFIVDIRRSIVQNIMLMTVLISNIGFLSTAVSKDLTGVVISTKIMYVGACFMPILFFFSVCEVCHFRINSILRTFLVLLQVVVYSLVLSIGYSDVYYKNISYACTDGVGMILRQYGPTHFLFPLTVYGYLAAAIFVSVYTCLVKKRVERKAIVIMMICTLVTSASYGIQHMINLGLDITPIMYIIFVTCAIVPIYRSDIFDVVENDEVIHEQLGRVGFVSFDSRMRYMGGNDYVINLLPELIEAPIGYGLTNPPEELKPAIREISLFLEERGKIKKHCHVEGSNLKIGDRTFKTEIHSLMSSMHRCVGATLEIRDISEHIRMLELTERYNENLEHEVFNKTEKIRMIQSKTILGMAQMVESRDLSTGGHIKRTSEVVRIFSKKLLESDMGYDRRFLRLVTRSAPMHDLGKIGVDDCVLRKQGKFTDDEYEKMKKHSEIGGKMVMDILAGVEEDDFVKIAFNVANYHHEKVNGTGYPTGLQGDEIPIEARIMALADVFDALVSKRCYKDAFTYDKAFSIIENDAGSHFDAKLVPIFLSCREELEAYYNVEGDAKE